MGMRRISCSLLTLVLAVGLAFVAAPAQAEDAQQFWVTPTGLDFGVVQVGETSAAQQTQVTNIGSAPVTLNLAGGAPGAPFTATQNCQGQTLAPGESCQLTYRFAPEAAGPAEASSNFSVNGESFSVALSGLGVAERFRVTPTGLDFGPVQVGETSAAQQAVVTNIGSAPVTLNLAGGAPGAPFTATQNCQGRTLAPGESCQLTYRFVPEAAGPAEASSNFSVNGESFSVALSGLGVAERFRVTPTGLDFGPVQVGETSAAQQTQVTNIGSAPVTLNLAGGAPGAPFTATQNCQGRTLAPGESCQLTYRFAPADAGPAEASSNFSVNGQSFSVQLTGTGITPVITVLVDIKPGEEPNCVNPASKGRLPVAVLAEEDFDPATIGGTSIALEGVAPVHDAAEDVDDDGLVDRILMFPTRDLERAGVLIDGAALELTGALADGTAVEGEDTVFLGPGPSC